MLARLILSLLLAAFAFPATATMPCHDGATPMAMNEHRSIPAMPTPDDQAMAAHSCPGCIPPSSLKVAVIGPSRPTLGGRPHVAIARLDLYGAPAPATPPPRIGG